jgi:secreted protein with Ig-like and vWFA domain
LIELKAIVKREREKGITLSTVGFGSGNYNDALIESIADVGNGNSSYIDSVREADKVLGDEMGATLITVAKNCATIPPYQIPLGQALPLGQRRVKAMTTKAIAPNLYAWCVMRRD